MFSGFEQLTQKEYPGRFILLGRYEESFVAVYGVTARSAASRAKRYVLNSNQTRIAVEATDETVLAQGDLSLLDYTAVQFFGETIVVTNGRQGNSIYPIDGLTTKETLMRCLKNWSYEDDVYSTPRITGMFCPTISGGDAALSIIRANDQEEAVHTVYPVSLVANQGLLLTTYAGPNVRPTPVNQEPPFPVTITASTATELAHGLFADLAPKPEDQDLRVSVIAIYQRLDTGERDICIVNTEK